MKVLVTGAAGQLGVDLASAFSDVGDEVAALSHGDLDVTDRSAVEGCVGAVAPDVVVNCAAWTAVDACEEHPKRAMVINGTAVTWLAEACRNADAHLVQISTDYVFDGTKASPYIESDAPAPMSAYGRSKLAGEVAALSIDSSCVVRTSWVCGLHGANMVRTILRLIDKGAPLRFVTDQVGSPSFTADLAPALVRLSHERRQGIFHLTNSGSVSWYEFTKAVAAEAGLDPTEVTPILTADLNPPRPAPRPANSVLADTKLAVASPMDESAGRSSWPTMRDFREPLRELVRQLRAQAASS